MIRRMPVIGARTTPVKNATIPTTAKASGGTSRPGSTSRQSIPKKRPSWAPQHEHRCEQAAGRPGRIRHGAEAEAKQERQWKQGKRRGPSERALYDRLATAHRSGHEPCHDPELKRYQEIRNLLSSPHPQPRACQSA
jgi:hypothetical protein